MSHEGGPEQPQRTVAELLAKYGAESGNNQPRRRRRRADDMTDTGAQQIIDRVMSESGEMQAIRDDMPPPERTSHRRGADRSGYHQQPEPRRRQPPPPAPGQQSQRIPRSMPAQPSQQLPRPNPGPGPGQQSSSRMSAMGRQTEPPPVRGGGYPPQQSGQLPRSQPSQRIPLPPPPPGGTRDRTGMRSRLDGDAPPAPPPPAMPAGSADTTEELPRVPGRVPVDGSMSGRRPGPGGDSRTQISPVYPPHDPYADMPPDEDDYHRNPYPPADPDNRYDTSERYGDERYD